jgi:hypothetical protein
MDLLHSLEPLDIVIMPGSAFSEILGPAASSSST